MVSLSSMSLRASSSICFSSISGSSYIFIWLLFRWLLRGECYYSFWLKIVLFYPKEFNSLVCLELVALVTDMYRKVFWLLLLILLFIVPVFIWERTDFLVLVFMLFMSCSIYLIVSILSRRSNFLMSWPLSSLELESEFEFSSSNSSSSPSYYY